MYNQIARFYDLTHQYLTADIAYILRLAQSYGGPVLELGCGTGRILLPLARAGFAVTGVDNSPAMLALAQSKLAAEAAAVQARVTLLAGDMVQLAVNGRFPLIIIPYNTFMHLTPAQMGQALAGVRGCLAANGRLFLDLANPFLVADTPNDRFVTLEAVVPDPQSGDTIVLTASNRLDAAAQQLHVTWLYDASPLTGGPVQRHVAQTDYHYLFPHQLELLLSEAGFHLTDLYGDYDHSPFSEDTDRLLLLCRR